jgi:hypothetical protein
MGVQIFAGKFYRCVYQNLTRLSAEDDVENRAECLSKNLTWKNTKINFDNTLNGYLGS